VNKPDALKMVVQHDEAGIIGIVGGIGPYAGLDLNRKILDQTLARRDQDHVNVLMLSWPGHIPDRSAFLIGQSQDDPTVGILRCLRVLERAGASVAGIACNTAHSPRIFNAVTKVLRDSESRIAVVNMIYEVAMFLRTNYPAVKNVGVLGTDGTIRANAYAEVLSEEGISTTYPDPDVQHSRVHPAIYDSVYGIKACSEPVTEKARKYVLEAAHHVLEDKGADALVLGCTELPLVVRERQLYGKPVIDPTLILARALIARVAPDKLVPLDL
jgi:aspartate racemase